MYSLEQFLDWGDAVGWGNLPRKPTRHFLRFHDLPKSSMNKKARQEFLQRYEAIREHPNKRLIPSMDMVDDFITGRAQWK